MEKVWVIPEELQPKMRSKRDLYTLFKFQGRRDSKQSPYYHYLSFY